MKDVSRNIAARVPKDLEEEIERFMKDKGVDKSAAIRKILEMGIGHWRLERAVDLYRRRRVTLWKASQMAKVSLREMMEQLKVQKLQLHITVEDIEQDIQAAKKAESDSG